MPQIRTEYVGHQRWKLEARLTNDYLDLSNESPSSANPPNNRERALFRGVLPWARRIGAERRVVSLSCSVVSFYVVDTSIALY